jgi:hypothetical protein
MSGFEANAFQQGRSIRDLDGLFEAGRWRFERVRRII